MIKKIIVVLLCVFVASCGLQPIHLPDDRDVSDIDGKSMHTKKTKTAVLLPLSSQSSSIGDSFRNAMLMASLERSSDEATTISFYDTKGSPVGATEAYYEAVHSGADIILGPVFSNEVEAIADLDPSIPVVAFTSNPQSVQKGIYSLALMIPNQIQRVVDFACQRGELRFALLGPKDKSGELVLNAFEQEISRCPGMEVTHISLYDPAQGNLTTSVEKIAPPLIDAKKKDLTDEEKELLLHPSAERIDFDALFVFEQGVKLQQLVSLLGYYDVTPNLVSFYGLATLRHQHNRDLRGAYFADLPQEKLRVFKQNYKAAFSSDPLMISSLGYDALSLVSYLSKNNALSESALVNEKGYQGTNGKFRLKRDGTNEHLLEMFQVRGKGYIVKVDLAPADF